MDGVARNRIHIDAPPASVFAVLADAERYPEWVVGAAKMRDQEEGFPEPGSRFHHSVKIGLLRLNDHTEVIDVDPPSRIVLEAKARPLGTARISIELSEGDGGTNVLMEEQPGDRLTALVAGNPVADLALRLRNAEALSRLKRVVEGRETTSSPSKPEIDGMRVLITGGSSGIGLASAEALAREGARVALLARGEEGLAAAARRLRDQGLEVETVVADVTEREALTVAVDQASERLGGLDLLVTAAASLSFGAFVETDPDDFDATIATVLGGAVNTIRAALPHLERSGGGLIAIGSTAARMPLPTLPAYTAAKHALAGFLECLRVELGEAGSPVSVSLVNPGAVDTPLWNNLESATGLLPPAPPDLYTADAVAEVVLKVARRPRRETFVGREAALQVALYSLLRGPAERVLSGLARLALSGGDRPASQGALSKPAGAGEVSGGFRGRPSLGAAAAAGLDRARRMLRAG
jgi:NAD(P)-dependent dehydrogenase (short-subunit alcohol dehydrogenase family)/uncharacterized protein YndB with AHSA1/START domain